MISADIVIEAIWREIVSEPYILEGKLQKWLYNSWWYKLLRGSSFD